MQKVLTSLYVYGIIYIENKGSPQPDREKEKKMENKKGDYKMFLEWLTCDKCGEFYLSDGEIFIYPHYISIKNGYKECYTLTVDGVSVIIYDLQVGELIDSATLVIRTIDEFTKKQKGVY